MVGAPISVDLGMYTLTLPRHSDHSGGLLALLRYRRDMIAHTSSEATKRAPQHIIVDLHPDRPIARGIAPPPTYTKVIGRLPEDPSFDEIQDAGGTVELNANGHTAGGGTVYVSGSIPRVTEFEGGLLGGVRWFEDNGKGEWKAESVSAPFFFLLLGDTEFIRTLCSISWTSDMQQSTSLAKDWLFSAR